MKYSLLQRGARFKRVADMWRAFLGSTTSSLLPSAAHKTATSKPTLPIITSLEDSEHGFSSLRYPFSVNTVQLSNGVTLAYIDEGTAHGVNGETIIFLHGLGSYIPAWSKNIGALREQYRCIALDFPGYGKSSKGEYPFSMEFYADTVKELMDALNIYKATLCGHSMGGQVAMTAALRHPERVKQLILVDPAGLEQFSARETSWMRNAVTAKGIASTPEYRLRLAYRLNFYRMPSDTEPMIQDRLAMRSFKDFDLHCYALAKSVHAMIDAPVIERLPEISQQTLILFGENDTLIPNPLLHWGRPVDVARFGASSIQNSRLVMIPKCGHFAQFEQPEAVNNAIRAFLPALHPVE